MTANDASKRDSRRTKHWLTIARHSGARWSIATQLVPILRPFQHLLYLCVKILPRNNKLWVFGSWGGTRYADNAAALFQFTNACEEAKVRCVWITDNSNIRDQVRSLGYEAHMKMSIAGIVDSLRAGVYIFDGLTKDINHWTSNGAKRVLLRHGVGIKKIERAIDQKDHRLYQMFHGRWWQRLLWTFLVPWHQVKPDLVLASSSTHAKQAERFFDVEKSNTAITGMPRTDALYNTDQLAQIPEQVNAWIEATRKSGRAVVLYLPTFRDDGSASVPFDWPLLDKLLAGTRANILFKAHPADNSISTALNTDFQHVLTVPANIDPSTLLPMADCFVTDYSSVVYDFMLLRRPVIFFCPDLEKYQQFSRSLDIPYEDASPGKKVRTLTELVDAIKTATPEGARPQEISDDYKRVIDMFHAFHDGDSSQRVHNEIYKRFVLSTATVDGDR